MKDTTRTEKRHLNVKLEKKRNIPSMGLGLEWSEELVLLDRFTPFSSEFLL